MKKILVLLGPNLNMVGIREKGIYGNESAESISDQIIECANNNGFSADIFQSNHEGDLIDKIHSGNYIICGIKHCFRFGHAYTMEMKCVTDGTFGKGAFEEELEKAKK